MVKWVAWRARALGGEGLPALSVLAHGHRFSGTSDSLWSELGRSHRGGSERPPSALSRACVQAGEMLVAERKQGLTAELFDPLRSGLVWLVLPPRLADVRGLSPSEILLGRRYRRTRHAAASRKVVRPPRTALVKRRGAQRPASSKAPAGTSSKTAWTSPAPAGPDGAEAILKLRAIITNGDFDAYWAHHLAQEHDRVHKSRYANRTIPQHTSN